MGVCFPLRGEGMNLDHFTTERTIFQIGLPPSRVDFPTSLPGLDSAGAYAGRKTVSLGDLQLPFLSLPDLITARKCAARDQDLRDLGALSAPWPLLKLKTRKP